MDVPTLRLFSRVARLGSFSAAARELGVSQSQVSRAIAELEERLGGRLLTRTTRAVMLTDSGAEFLARLEPILLALEEAEHTVREGSELRGALRVSMPTSIGTREVIPRMARFVERHPRLRIHFGLDDRRQDLIRDAVDVSLRVGPLRDSTATFETLGHIERVAIAAPSSCGGQSIQSRHHRVSGRGAAPPPNQSVIKRRGRSERLGPLPWAKRG
jgi:molybdate transport repressor ModE-like protein